MNIYQRVQKVMQAVAYVKKDKNVTGAGEGYMAVTHDNVTAMVRPHFVAAGIVLAPRVVSSAMVDTTRRSKSGNPAMRYEGRFAVDFVNIDDPADRITVELDAHADDYGDKAPGKALSYATKYAVLKLLMLETGEDDEGRLGPPQVEYTDAEQATIQELRDAALNGRDALKSAWQGLTKEQRQALSGELDSLKAAAAGEANA
jgi:hypothetical protein